jgi:hypothetical protein
MDHSSHCWKCGANYFGNYHSCPGFKPPLFGRGGGPDLNKFFDLFDSGEPLPKVVWLGCTIGIIIFLLIYFDYYPYDFPFSEFFGQFHCSTFSFGSFFICICVGNFLGGLFIGMPLYGIWALIKRLRKRNINFIPRF